MNYFGVSLETDESIIGKYPQVEDLVVDFQAAKASQFGRIKNWQGEADYPDFHQFKLNSGAKLTDVLTNTFVNIYSGVLISQPLADLLLDFRLARFQHADATVHQGNTPHPYVFAWYSSAHHLIDFSRSEVRQYHRVDSTFGEEVSVQSEQEFFTKNLALLRRSKYQLKPQKLVLTQSVDLIRFQFDTRLICSEALKNQIENHDLTGFRFSTLDFEISP